MSNRTVWKYTLSRQYVGDLCSVVMPKDAVILKVASQNDEVTFWADVISTNELETRHFYIVGTGFDVPPNGKYVGTAFCGSFVWHVYEPW
jgi:hypothetical protein